MDAFEKLAASYFDGRLTERNAEGLARVLETDPQRAAWFVGEYEIDRLLALRAMPADQSQIDAILLQIERETDPFVQSVFRRIEHEASAPVVEALSGRNWLTALFSQFRWALLSAACLVLLFCAWFFYFGVTVGEPRLEFAENSAVTVLRNGMPVRAQHGFALRAGDVLKVPGTNIATISFIPEKTHITNLPGTELKLVSVSGRKSFVLDAGKIEASVAPQRIFKPLVIVTPHAQARVLGTHFTLAADTNSTRLEVAEGNVRFTRLSDGKRVNVGAGNYTFASANSELAALPLTGSILYEFWTNFPSISDFWWDSLSVRPSGIEYPGLFEAPRHTGSNFLARIRGYVQPPQTGDYTFWIAGDSGCVFSLSPDAQPQNKVDLATANNIENPRDWTDDRNLQQTSTITLIAGLKYYIEAVQKYSIEAARKPADSEHHLAVAWQGPGRPREVIPGKFLSPIQTPVVSQKGER